MPVNVRPGYAATLKATVAPTVTPATYASGTGTTSRSLSRVITRSIGADPAGPLLGPTRAPGWILRSVTRPSNGAVTLRYRSMSVTDCRACRAASAVCPAAATSFRSASTAF